jgi:hypothetical protein
MICAESYYPLTDVYKSSKEEPTERDTLHHTGHTHHLQAIAMYVISLEIETQDYCAFTRLQV